MVREVSHAARERWIAFLAVLMMTLLLAVSIGPALQAGEVAPRPKLGPARADAADSRSRIVGTGSGRSDGATVDTSGSPLPSTAHPRQFTTGGVRVLVVSRSDQTVTLYEADGTMIDGFPCATGVYYPVPGVYSVYGHRGSGASPDDGSRFQYFTVFASSHRGVSIGFHSIPVDRQGRLLGGLGEPISHGCVRLELEKARFVYDWAVNGSRVIVYP